MTTTAILLVLLSALAHASWNFLTKRAHEPEVFTWWATATSNAIFLPLAIVLLVRDRPDPIGWAFVAATWCLHVVYFVTLSRGYAHTDLSLVYPVARGLGVMLIPLLGVLWLGEHMSSYAVLGVALIVVGLFTLTWWGQMRAILHDPLRLLRDPGIRYALVTGCVIGTYSNVDKQGVSHVTPFLYMYLLQSAGTIGLFPFAAKRFPRRVFMREWRTHWQSILAGGALQYAAYGLVLTALTVAKVAYVGPFREIGVVFGVMLGTALLHEPFGRGRVFGASLIAAGAITIALAP